MIRKIKLLLIMISLLIITSCTIDVNTQNNQTKKEYIISYFINGEEVFLQPEKYTEGIGCNLPTPDVDE